MNIDTKFLRRRINTLELALEGISRLDRQKDLTHEIYRAACVKEFELVLEQSGKLLTKRLAIYFSSTVRLIDSRSRIYFVMPQNTVF